MRDSFCSQLRTSTRNGLTKGEAIMDCRLRPISSSSTLTSSVAFSTHPRSSGPWEEGGGSAGPEVKRIRVREGGSGDRRGVYGGGRVQSEEAARLWSYTGEGAHLISVDSRVPSPADVWRPTLKYLASSNFSSRHTSASFLSSLSMVSSLRAALVMRFTSSLYRCSCMLNMVPSVKVLGSMSNSRPVTSIS